VNDQTDDVPVVGHVRLERGRSRVPAALCLLAALAGVPGALAAPFTSDADLRDALDNQTNLAPLGTSPPVVTLLMRAATPQRSGSLRLWTGQASRLPVLPAVRPAKVLASPGLWVGVTNPRLATAVVPRFVHLARVGDVAGVAIAETFDERTGAVTAAVGIDPSRPRGPGRALLTWVPFVARGGLVVFEMDRLGRPKIVVAVDYGASAPPARRTSQEITFP
jgi:hypothetical protein